MTYPVKEFVLTHVVENVLQLDGTTQYSQIEKHFNVPWRISYCKNNDFLYFILNCEKQTNSWSIDAEFELRVKSANADTLCAKHTRQFNFVRHCWGRTDFVTWNMLEKLHVVDGKITLEVHVKILKMIGCGKEKLRNFDEAVKEFSDVVLVVKNEKFYVLKLFLAFQSTYFKSLLLGKFDESKQSEVILKDIDPEDFQNFLELIHGESVIDDNTIDGIIHLADMYDSPVAVRRCEEFLIEKSKLPMKKKLLLSTKYHLENLKNKCLTEINTVEDIRSVMAGGLDEMDASVAKALLQKSISLH